VNEKSWDWPDTPTVRKNLEALSALARAIELAAPGRFVLLFAKCNVPAQRTALTERLGAMLEPLGIELVDVAMEKPVESLLGDLEARMQPKGKHRQPKKRKIVSVPAPAVAEPGPAYSEETGSLALSVRGLERSLRSDDPNPPLLAHLNQARERYRELGCPLLLWLPDYALTRLAREAPDFWAWRSGVFEFAPEPEVAESALEQMAYEPDLVSANLDAAAKRERLALLRQLLDDYRELGDGPRERDAQADILWKMGNLYHDLGEYDASRRAYRDVLAIKRELDDERGVGGLLHNLGRLAQDQGDYDQARQLYQDSLDIAQQLGDRAGVAITLHQLGVLAHLQGDYDQAHQLYQDSLDIKQQLGNRVGAARTLHQLGMLNQNQGDYDQARRFYQDSLDIKQQIGDRAGVASSLHQLGTLAEEVSDLEKAESLFAKSLKMFKHLGSPDTDIARRSLARVRGQLEEQPSKIKGARHCR
jgi:tetratricopeptide (TPR) repeat protein